MCNITCTYTRFFDETLRANVKQSTLALTIPLKIYSNEISKWTFMLFVKITKAPYKAYGNKEKHRESSSLPLTHLNFNLKEQQRKEKFRNRSLAPVGNSRELPCVYTWSW